MFVAQKMLAYSERSSWIRKMFEEGARLRAIHGADKVYDFSLGNPDVPPPARVVEVMQELAGTMNHGYMPNAGYPEVRETIAARASKTYEVPLQADDIIMTCGAGGGLNVVLKAILNPGDEVLAIAPYFVEYGFYAENHGGSLVVAHCDEDFLPDLQSVKEALSERTKAIIINSPNNPTGRVYPASLLEGLRDLLEDRPDILVIADEPYRRLVYDDIDVPSVLNIIPRSLVVTSASKELSLAGQRIGYIALGPGIEDKQSLMSALILATRILGFVNAPALQQQVLASCLDCCVDMDIYARRRDLLTSACDQAGLSYVPPEGTFYLFVRSPIPDDVAFCRALQEERILAVPGQGFGQEGYVRFAYCVDERTITAAGPGLKRAAASLR